MPFWLFFECMVHVVQIDSIIEKDIKFSILNNDFIWDSKNRVFRYIFANIFYIELIKIKYSQIYF